MHRSERHGPSAPGWPARRRQTVALALAILLVLLFSMPTARAQTSVRMFSDIDEILIWADTSHLDGGLQEISNNEIGAIMRQIIDDGLKKDRPKIKVTSVSAEHPGRDDPKKLLMFVRLSMQPLRLSYEEAQVAGLRGRWVIAWTASVRRGGPQDSGLQASPFGPVPRAILLSSDRSTWRDTLIEGFRPSIQRDFVRPLIEPPIR